MYILIISMHLDWIGRFGCNVVIQFDLNYQDLKVEAAIVHMHKWKSRQLMEDLGGGDTGTTFTEVSDVSYQISFKRIDQTV